MKSGKKKNRGTSMITVVISFVLLMLFVVSYMKVQRLSENMMMDSKDRIVNNGQLIKKYYLGKTQDQIEGEQIELQFMGKKGSFFVYATLNSAKVDGLDGTIYYYGEKTEDAEKP